MSNPDGYIVVYQPQQGPRKIVRRFDDNRRVAVFDKPSAEHMASLLKEPEIIPLHTVRNIRSDYFSCTSRPIQWKPESYEPDEDRFKRIWAEVCDRISLYPPLGQK